MEGIVFGKRYPLKSSISGHHGSLSRTQSTAVTTLQYVFKPSSVDDDRSGSLSISDTNEVLISLPVLESDENTESFKGTATKPFNECVLSFNGDSFALDKVSSAVTNIRHSRNESTFSTKDNLIGDARKFHKKTLQLKKGPRPVKKLKTANPKTENLKVAVKESESEQILSEQIPSSAANSTSAVAEIKISSAENE